MTIVMPTPERKAQQVFVIPEKCWIGVGGNTPWSLDYGNIVSIIVKSGKVNVIFEDDYELVIPESQCMIAYKKIVPS